jgi:hypothetical protein
MLISNGVKTRNIAENQLPEYKAKGYEVVNTATSTPKKPTKKGDK